MTSIPTHKGYCLYAFCALLQDLQRQATTKTVLHRRRTSISVNYEKGFYKKKGKIHIDITTSENNNYFSGDGVQTDTYFYEPHNQQFRNIKESS